jgi:hypothetical protein
MIESMKTASNHTRMVTLSEMVRFSDLAKLSVALVLTLFGIILWGMGPDPLAAEEPGSSNARMELERRANEIQNMNPRMAKEAIRSLNESEAIGVYDLMVSQAASKGVGPQVFYLAEHIQLLRATQASQKRLESLIWVLALTLILFSGYLTYVLIDQRRIYRKLLALKETRKSGSNEPREVYTGE